MKGARAAQKTVQASARDRGVRSQVPHRLAAVHEEKSGGVYVLSAPHAGTTHTHPQ